MQIRNVHQRLCSAGKKLRAIRKEFIDKETEEEGITYKSGGF